MFVQTAATSTLISTHCGTSDRNGFHQSSSFLITQVSVSACLLNSRCHHLQSVLFCKSRNHLKPCCLSKTTGSNDAPDPEARSNMNGVGNGRSPKDGNGSSVNDINFPKLIPRKPRRGRKSEAVAVEDYIRNSLEKTFASIREKSSVVPENMEHVMKGQTDEENDSEFSDREDKNDDVGKKGKKKMVIEDESNSWPLDADVGWGTRASEYFDQHPIRNTMGDDGVEIDWEGEMDEGWVKEINCLEWEEFAFHPSPLIVLVFERYKRASDNWKVLRELEKAAKVYWDKENCLPPRTVKIDINIERDLASALKVQEGPELLFLRGNRIIFRERNIRTSAELVQMIAHFYYKAKKPAWI